MATITNVGNLSAQQLPGNNWKLTVTYDASFSDREVRDRYQYRDSFVVWEEDSSIPDRITGRRSVGTFTPSARTVRRTLTTQVTGDMLDTELGAEEIYVFIHLENQDIGVEFEPKRSATINIAP